MSVMDRFRLDGRVAVVTGGAGLYGAGFCRALAEAGAAVLLTSRDRDKAAAAAAPLRDEGLQVSAYELDQSAPSSVAGFHQRALAEHGRIDVLVNNAVYRQGGDLSSTSEEDWDATSAANSKGLFLMCKEIGGGMAAAGGGAIVNVGSIYGLVAPDFSLYEGTTTTMPAFYAYDKAGMVGFTKYLAAAFGPDGVRVNCLCPGGLQHEQSPVFLEAYAQRTPLGRMATADDVNGVLVFLSSPAASYMTGAVVPVDGGWTAR